MRTPITHDPGGVRYRDLNRNGRLDPFEDLRLSLEEKFGLLFHTVIEAGTDGSVLEGPGAISKSGTRDVVLGKHITHFNVHALGTPTEAARWHNAVQALAEEAPHGIPAGRAGDGAGSSVSRRCWPTPDLCVHGAFVDSRRPRPRRRRAHGVEAKGLVHHGRGGRRVCHQVLPGLRVRVQGGVAVAEEVHGRLEPGDEQQAGDAHGVVDGGVTPLPRGGEHAEHVVVRLA